MDRMICGGVYQVNGSEDTPEQGTLVCMTIDQHGTKRGVMLLAGHAPETIEYASSRWAQFSLVGRPASPNVGRPKKG
ncbi:MAG: hypothetical protein GOVbin1923_15 [Prokaryotic dsDNA virus sp.]|nr:MAG: hypothetical protein GOVbin1923_15 [Prokaryotic dsDNA virus sp.]